MCWQSIKQRFERAAEFLTAFINGTIVERLQTAFALPTDAVKVIAVPATSEIAHRDSEDCLIPVPTD